MLFTLRPDCTYHFFGAVTEHKRQAREGRGCFCLHFQRTSGPSWGEHGGRKLRTLVFPRKHEIKSELEAV